VVDFLYMMASIPPKYSVSSVAGFIKGKSAVHLVRAFGEQKQNHVRQSFWVREHFVSMGGRNESTILGEPIVASC